VRKIEQPEGGSSLAWTAVVLTTLLLPLMLLIVDGSRLWYIRGRMQTATDAACEAAAWVGGDRSNYQDSGQTRISDEWYLVSVAQDTFASTLNESTRMAFNPQLAVTIDDTSNQILCSGAASVPILFNVVGVEPQVNVLASSMAAIRFR
jgi:Flp pilus assembly protein TadG